MNGSLSYTIAVARLGPKPPHLLEEESDLVQQMIIYREAKTLQNPYGIVYQSLLLPLTDHIFSISIVQIN